MLAVGQEVDGADALDLEGARADLRRIATEAKVRPLAPFFPTIEGGRAAMTRADRVFEVDIDEHEAAPARDADARVGHE